MTSAFETFCKLERWARLSGRGDVVMMLDALGDTDEATTPEQTVAMIERIAVELSGPEPILVNIEELEDPLANDAEGNEERQ